MRCFAVTCGLALALTVNLAAHAEAGGPPLLTDDPGTPGPGNWEINVAAPHRHVGSSSEGESPLLDLNFGVGERVQLKYEIAWVARREAGDTVRGLGSSLLGVKWRFADSGEKGWNISTYP